MFVKRVLGLAGVTGLGLVLALGGPGASNGGGPEKTYVVRSNDTLWDVARRSYGGDPRKGVWLIGQRNGLEEGAVLHPGLVLVLP
jgi:nucleoid-associated protein YgaU